MRRTYATEIHGIIKEELNLDPNLFKITESFHDKQPITILSTIDDKMHFKFLNPASSWERFQVAYTLYIPNFGETDWKPPGPRHLFL